MGTRLFWPVFFKRQSLQFWMTFLDKFGSPTALGKYPVGATMATKQTLLSALQAISQEAQIAVPVGMEVTLLEAAKTANSGYEQLCRYLDDEMSKAVLGETMSTGGRGGGGLGSNQANVQNEVRLELTKADGDLLAGTLNKTVIAWDVAYNLPGAKPPRLSWDVSEALDRFNTAQADNLVFGMGFKPDIDYITETYGEGWTEKPAAPPPGQLPGLPIPPGGNPPAPALAEGSPGQAILMAQRADPSLDAWIAAVRKIVDESKSIEELRDRLMSAFPQMSVTELAKAMQAAFAAAQLAGRYDLTHGYAG